MENYKLDKKEIKDGLGNIHAVELSYCGTLIAIIRKKTNKYELSILFRERNINCMTYADAYVEATNMFNDFCYTINSTATNRYLIVTDKITPYYTNRYDYDVDYVEGMKIYDLWMGKFSVNGSTWIDIN